MSDKNNSSESQKTNPKKRELENSEIIDYSISSIVKTKKKKPYKPTLDLEVPTFIYDADAEYEKEQAEIQKHGGRIRTLPVQKGAWPLAIYISSTTS